MKILESYIKHLIQLLKPGRGKLTVPTTRPHDWPFESWESPTSKFVSAKNSSLPPAIQLTSDTVRVLSMKIPWKKRPHIVLGFVNDKTFDFKAVYKDGTIYIGCSLVAYVRIASLFYIFGMHPNAFPSSKNTGDKALNTLFECVSLIPITSIREGIFFTDISLLSKLWSVAMDHHSTKFHTLAHNGTLAFLLFALRHEVSHIFSQHSQLLRSERMALSRTYDIRNAFEFCADYHAMFGVYTLIHVMSNKGSDPREIDFDKVIDNGTAFGFSLGLFFLLKELAEPAVESRVSPYPRPLHRLHTLAAMQIVDCIKGEHSVGDTHNILKHSILSGITTAHSIVKELTGEAFEDETLSAIFTTKFNCINCNLEVQPLLDLSKQFLSLMETNRDLLQTYALNALSNPPTSKDLEKRFRIVGQAGCRMPPSEADSFLNSR